MRSSIQTSLLLLVAIFLGFSRATDNGVFGRDIEARHKFGDASYQAVVAELVKAKAELKAAKTKVAKTMTATATATVTISGSVVIQTQTLTETIPGVAVTQAVTKAITVTESASESVSTMMMTVVQTVTAAAAVTTTFITMTSQPNTITATNSAGLASVLNLGAL